MCGTCLVVVEILVLCDEGLELVGEDGGMVSYSVGKRDGRSSM